MTFLTSYMEAMLSAATDPEEIALRQKVLDDHVAHQKASPGDLDHMTVELQPEPLAGAGAIMDNEPAPNGGGGSEGEV